MFGNRQGIAVGLISLMLVVLLGMCALAVDLGMMVAARTEAQRAADAGALSGALSLYESKNDEDRAREKAIETAEQNTVHGTSTEVRTGDVVVDLPNRSVRVKVVRAASRGSAIATLFARALGINASNVSAMATAQLSVARGVECPLPFAVVDRWWESDGHLAQDGDEFDAADDVYNEGPLGALPGSAADETGYGEPDRGSILRIYPGDPSDTPLPGWSYLLELNDTGGDEVRKWIAGCEQPEQIFSYGDDIDIKTGMTTGPVDQGIADLIAKDPTAYWGTGVNSPAGGCVFRPGAVDANNEPVCVDSPRIRPTVLISPLDIPTKSGNTMVELQNFVGVFVVCAGNLQPSQSSCSGNMNSKGGGLQVRFIDYRGVNALGPTQNGGSLVRVLQLVQ
jgi:Flp pilus assembly protein TadG